MIKYLLVFLSGMFVVSGFAQSPEAYVIYKANGKKAKYNKMIKKMNEADVVLFGELHDNSLCHWMQLEVTKSIFGKDSIVTMGAEMFEADNQLIMDEYLNGVISKRNFEKEMRMWPNYKNDYKPLVEFAKEYGIRFIATNVPRRYASYVNKNDLEGLDSLSDEAKKFLPPLPVPFDTLAPNYAEMMEMDMDSEHGGGAPMLGIVQAQAIKDATMAHFIIKNLEKDITFIHFQGDFHSKNYGAISWYLNKYKPGLNIVTLSTVEAENLDFDDEYSKLADYILVIPESMTKTY